MLNDNDNFDDNDNDDNNNHNNNNDTQFVRPRKPLALCHSAIVVVVVDVGHTPVCENKYDNHGASHPHAHTSADRYCPGGRRFYCFNYK